LSQIIFKKVVGRLPGKIGFPRLRNNFENCILVSIETAGGASVSSGCWGEDGDHGLAGAAHFHVASPALLFSRNSFSKLKPTIMTALFDLM
jgi:hypothetical protein